MLQQVVMLLVAIALCWGVFVLFEQNEKAERDKQGEETERPY